MAHTPGPWFHFKKEGTTRLQVGAGKYDIAELRHAGGEDAEQANANLIAAAPDLLMSCRMLVALEDGDVHEADTSWKQARKIMREAINKAEGRTA